MTAPPPPWGQPPLQYGQPGSYGQPGQYGQLPPRSGQPWRPPVDPSDPLVSTDYAGWWRRGTALLGRCWRQLLVLQLFVAALTVLLRGPTTYFQLSRSFEQLDAVREGRTVPAENPLTSLATSGLGLVGTLLTLVATAVVALAGVHVVVTAAAGGAPSAAAALRGASRWMLPMLGWSLLAGLMTGLGVCFCVLPAFYFYAVFLILPAVVAFERTEPFTRCFRLFHADLGAAAARTATVGGLVLGGLLVVAVVSGIVVAVVAAGGVGAAGVIGGSAFVLLVSILVGTPIAMLTVPLLVVAYADLRARQEPLSTARLAGELAR